MKQTNTRNLRFLGFLLAFATATSSFNSCKKDSAALPNKTTVSDSGLAASPPKNPATVTTPSSNGTPFSFMLGVNTYAWNYFNSSPGTIDPAQMSLIRSFSQVRHYLDWSSLEYTQGSYSYNPVYSGSWNLDAIYTSCNTDGVTALVDIKTCP